MNLRKASSEHVVSSLGNIRHTRTRWSPNYDKPINLITSCPEKIRLSANQSENPG
jgi:hypothetical protein